MKKEICRKLAAFGSAAVLSGSLSGCGTSSAKLPETPEEFRAAAVERAVVSVGNTARLHRVFEKAADGGNITISYVGGSITEGYAAGAKSPDCYASLSAAAFQSAYCKGGSVTCQNHGLAGTPSILGNLRVSQEVLPESPDIIFLEFAVNDGINDECRQSYESLVRTCLQAENEPAVILLFTYMENGHTCQDQQQEIGTHYDLGMISVRDAIKPEMDAGRMVYSDYGNDGVHPSKAGHAMIAEYIAKYFEQAAAAKPDSSYEIPAQTLHPALDQPAALYDAVNLTYKNGAWMPGTDNARFPTGFVYEPGTGNAPLSFTVTGKTLFLVYKLAKSKEFGMLGVYVNGELKKVINGSGGSDAWDGPEVKRCADFDAQTDMNVEIKMLDDHTDRQFEIFAFGVSG